MKSRGRLIGAVAVAGLVGLLLSTAGVMAGGDVEVDQDEGFGSNDSQHTDLDEHPETDCADAIDNEGDGLIDCQDLVDCDAKPCDDGNGCTLGDVCESSACVGTPTGNCSSN